MTHKNISLRGDILCLAPFGWGFEVAAVDLAVVHEVSAVFFEEDFDTAGDWDGDNCADKTESVDADSNGGENSEGWELHAFTLDFWRDDVGFDLEVDDGVDEECYASPDGVEAEQKRDDGAADEATKHWNKAEDAGDETEWEGEAWCDAEDETEDEDGDSGGSGVDECDRDGA